MQLCSCGWYCSVVFNIACYIISELYIEIAVIFITQDALQYLSHRHWFVVYTADSEKENQTFVLHGGLKFQ